VDAYGLAQPSSGVVKGGAEGKHFWEAEAQLALQWGGWTGSKNVKYPLTEGGLNGEREGERSCQLVHVSLRFIGGELEGTGSHLAGEHMLTRAPPEGKLY